MIENQNVRLAIVFVIGLIIGLGAYWVWDNRYVGDEEIDLLEDDTATTTEMIISSDNSVRVANQTAGNKVIVTEVKLANPGWVTVRDNVNGQPGKILGAKLFDKGTNSGEVELLRNTVAGTSYLVVLHMDDGDYKNFNAKTDTPLLTAENAMVMTSFTTEGASATPTTVNLDVSNSINLQKE